MLPAKQGLQLRARVCVRACACVCVCVCVIWKLLDQSNRRWSVKEDANRQIKMTIHWLYAPMGPASRAGRV